MNHTSNKSWKTLGLTNHTRVWVTSPNLKRAKNINTINALTLNGQSTTAFQKKTNLSSWLGRSFTLLRVVAYLFVIYLLFVFFLTNLKLAQGHVYVLITQTPAVVFCSITLFVGFFFLALWIRAVLYQNSSMWIYGLLALFNLSSAATFFKTLTSYGVFFRRKTRPLLKKQSARFRHFANVKNPLLEQKKFVAQTYLIFNTLIKMSPLDRLPVPCLSVLSNQPSFLISKALRKEVLNRAMLPGSKYAWPEVNNHMASMLTVRTLLLFGWRNINANILHAINGLPSWFANKQPNFNAQTHNIKTRSGITYSVENAPTTSSHTNMSTLNRVLVLPILSKHKFPVHHDLAQSLKPQTQGSWWFKTKNL